MRNKRFYASLCKLSPGALLRFHRLLWAVRNHDADAALDVAATFSTADRARFRRFLQEVSTITAPASMPDRKPAGLLYAANQNIGVSRPPAASVSASTVCKVNAPSTPCNGREGAKQPVQDSV